MVITFTNVSIEYFTFIKKHVVNNLTVDKCL